MTKRRRRSDSATRSSKRSPNPFLKFAGGVQETKREEDENVLFQSFLAFMELSKQKPQDSKIQIGEIVRTLLSSLDTAEKKESQGMVLSASDIVTLLLPWATKTIIRSFKDLSETETQWLTLERCLRCIVASSENGAPDSSSSSELLTLSVMHKLVPLAGNLAFQRNLPTTLVTSAGNCYCLMVNQFYSAPFDAVFDSVLSILGDGKVSLIQSEDHNLQSMAVSSLRLLLARLKKANPKKSFQLLVKSNVFTTLAGIFAQSDEWSEDPVPFIKDILVHGLFDLKQHMDGFRSIKMEIPDITTTSKMDVDRENDAVATKSAFHCYQEGLFSMIEEGLSPRDGKVSSEASLLVQILPLLLETFIEQTLVQQDQKSDNASSKKKASDGIKIMQLQFRFFASLSARLLSLLDFIDNEDEKMRAVIYVALEKNLNLLLKHDVYLPTNEDKNEVHFTFLFHLGQSLIKKVKDAEQASTTSVAESKHSLAILNALVRLNHLLLHDQLAEHMAFCITSKADSDSKSYPEASTFVCTLVMTYRKLRQLDYFCSSFVEVVEVLRTNEDTEGLQDLINVTQESEVRSQLAEAVSSSPINQLKEVFSKMNAWLVNLSTKSETERNLQSISAVVGMLVVLLQNVRVDMNTANEMYPLCEEIITGSVHSLLRVNKVNGLCLCGWTVALQNKCEFWMGSSIENDESRNQWFHMPEELLQILSEATDSTSIDETTVEGLQFLACQRIQRLHREIQEKQKIVFASDELKYHSDSQLAEAKKLARFALRAAISGTNEETWSGNVSRLHVLAESVASWAPYVDEDDMFSFLSRYFLGNAIEMSQSLSTESLLPLLQDAEFFEAPNVAATLGGALMSCTAQLTQKALGSSFDTQEFEQTVLCCPMRHPSWRRSTSEQLSHIVASDPKMNVKEIGHKRNGERKVYLEGARYCLNMLKNIRASLWVETENAIDAFDSAMRLDVVFRSLATAESDIRPMAVDILSTLREVASQILEGSQEESESPLIGDKKTFRKLPECISKTTVVLMDLTSSNVFAHSRLLNSCKRLIGSITIYSGRRAHLCEEYRKGILTVFDASKSRFGDNDILLLATLGACIVSKLTILMDSGPTPCNKLMAAVADDIQRCLWKDTLVIAFDAKPGNQLIKQGATYVVAELLKYSASQTSNSWLTAEVKHSLEDAVVQTAKDVLRTNPSDSGLHSTSYLIACLALVGPSHGTRNDLANEIIQVVVKTNSVLENAFCKLVEGLDAVSLEKVLCSLASFNAGGPEAPFRLRLFRLLVLNLASSDKLPVIAGFSRQFFFLSLQCFMQKKKLPEGPSDQSIQHAVALIIDMASNKDIISLRERDMALILTHVNSALNEIDGGDGSNFCPAPSIVYHSCFTMVSFLLQRFPKQLHSCVSLMTGIIAAMFQHTLYGELPQSDITARCQKFTRICELLLPHGEVYKKHVLGLLVEFVKALGGNMNLARKNGLSPALYCLLDILKEHENAQLNSMLDDMGRALLRSVHKNYQKLHVYKGQ
jgi:hypothetical protein